MNSEILFSENQRFSQWWLWLLLIGVNSMTLYGVIQQVIFGQPFGDKPSGDAGLLIAAAISLLIIGLFLVMRMETRITKDGIYVRFYPFHMSFKHYAWESLTKAYVRQYSAILEYGGWGLRQGLFGKGRAFNVSGNKGLQLEFNDQKSLLIGTCKPEEITETLRKLRQIKE